MGRVVHGVGCPWGGGIPRAGRGGYGAEGPWGRMPVEGDIHRGRISMGRDVQGVDVNGVGGPWGAMSMGQLRSPPSPPPPPPPEAEERRLRPSASAPPRPGPGLGAGRRQVVNGGRDGRKMGQTGEFLKS